MKFKIIAICSLAAIFVALSLFLVLIPKNVSSDKAEKKNIKSQIISSCEGNMDTKESEDIIDSPKFIVKEYNGAIGVFEIKDGKTLLNSVKDVKVCHLPENDKKLLTDGITAIGKEQLNSILEDYCS